MDESEFRQKWESIKGAAREHWRRLTDEDIKDVNGDRDAMIKKLQEKYNETREVAEQKVKGFERDF